MSDGPHIPIPRGVLWHEFRADDPAGDPLGQFAFVTPRFPEGIRATALQHQSFDIKREVALSWFLANLEPYALKHPPYITGGSWVVGVSRIAPDRISSSAALAAAFGSCIQAALRQEIAEGLPGDWMWREEPSTAPETILARLDDLAAAIGQMLPAPGQVGHNQPQFWSAADQASALATIADARARIEQHPEDAALVVAEHKSFFATWAPRLCLYAADLVDRFLKNAAESAGKATGPLLVVTVAALLGWHGVEWLMHQGH